MEYRKLFIPPYRMTIVRMLNEREIADGLREKDKQKVVFRDGEEFKAIRGWILDEDSLFLTLRATKTGQTIRIGKSFIVMIRPADFDQVEGTLDGSEEGGAV